MIILKQPSFAPDRAERPGRQPSPAVSRRDGRPPPPRWPGAPRRDGPARVRGGGNGARRRRRTDFGAEGNLWSPAAPDAAFDLSPSVDGAARTFPRLPHHCQQHRRAGMAEAFTTPEIGGDHFRARCGVPDAVASQADDGIGCDGRERRSIRSTRGRSVRTPRFHRCSSASKRSTIRAAANTTTRASTPTRSAGRRRASRCRCCAIRARFSTRCSAPAPRPKTAPADGARTRACSTRSSRRSIGSSGRSGAADSATAHAITSTTCAEIERRIQKVEAVRTAAAKQRALARMRRWACPIRSTEHVEADVRPAGDRARVGHHARVRVQDVARRVGPRVSRRRASPPVSTMPRTTTSGPRRILRLREDQQIPREPACRTSSSA